MPKVALTEKQKDFNRLGYNLKLIQGGRSPKDMAKILGCCIQTYYSRIKNPEKLTYEEIKRLCDFSRVDLQSFVCGTLKIM